MNHYNLDLTKTEDILIVDDTPDNLHLLSRMLTRQGYNVRKALNGAMALTAAQTVAPDLILLDIMMPEMDGYEVCQNLKANAKTAEIPVIFLSALDDVLDKVKGFQVGGVDYITKPFQFEEVLARVQNQLALRSAELEIRVLNSKLEARVKERTQQLEEANAKLLKMALHDALTGLPNRALLMTDLHQSIQRSKADPNYQFAVLFLDCDRFKVVNDSLGHIVGDELLILIARRLNSYIKPQNTLARLGGDEFAILLTEIPDFPHVIELADQILDSFSKPFHLERHEVFINASIGIVIGHSDYNEPEHLLRDADTAMYRAKALGKGQYHIFDPVMHAAALERLQLETDLRRGLEQQELVVHYQPIVDLNTGKIAGFEALVRWRHPERGLVPPGLFIPIAEETGLITPIGYWVLFEACHQLQTWQKQNLVDSSLFVSVNLSVKQFAQPNLLEQIDQVLEQSQLDPDCLKLEITESAIMENDKDVAIILKELRKRRILISIDDFGTGYSSLSYLHSFPVDTLKVDKSFVQRLNLESENVGLIPVIISLAKTMNMSVVAEGIELPEQLAILKELNCGFGQGYLFSKPLPGEQLIKLLSLTPQW
ncbi:bifunctional diguanylate cyclase/phosphodiesterase [Planktothrix sp. FACHB-1365]|uniref:putative bifunctional diguanylate cyclase/phosphodiesterase n=1 Tax=Planktothrix sp. FACHB-1365 TaxID=2692855 RepID=UPI001684EB7E|nr:GGDEF domain-containing response regulator [Planktothrix sp. FACHB-1365]MBD2485006.1 EAL domain-containing protein [Planktothrix sp. FACHB-1365]